MPMLAFMPWLRLREPVAIGDVRAVPVAAEGGISEASRAASLDWGASTRSWVQYFRPVGTNGALRSL
jgi:hypothetical protein